MVETRASDYLRQDRNHLVQLITSMGKTVRGDSCQCPKHDDASPSASIYRGKGDAWRVSCKVPSCGFYGDCFDVQGIAEGKPVADILRDINRGQNQSPQQQPPAPPAATDKQIKTYPTIDALTAGAIAGVKFKNEQDAELIETNPYTNPQTGRIDLVTWRFKLADGRKTFWQGHQRDDGLFAIGACPKPWPIFNRGRLVDAAFVVIVEGEKCVRALTPLGIVATTSPGGAANAHHADWTPLAGKTCYVWPDRDEPGRIYAETVTAKLAALGCDVKIIDPHDQAIGLTGDGDDVADFLDRLPVDANKAHAIDDVLARATTIDASAALTEEIEACIAGRMRTVPWPWPRLTTLTAACRPGTLTLVCGDPGSAKSFLVLESVLHWLRSNVSVALYELEETATYWQRRALAIAAGASGITSPEWMEANADDSRALLASNRGLMNKLAGCMKASPGKPVTYPDLLDWAEAELKNGRRVLVVDPVTAVAVGESQHVADLAFVNNLKTLVQNYGASAILVTHPRKTGKTKSLIEDMAGGAAFPRFSQCVLWLRHHSPPIDGHCDTGCGTIPRQWNRSAIIVKARNAPGAGRAVAFDFSGDTLRFSELGTVATE